MYESRTYTLNRSLLDTDVLSWCIEEIAKRVGVKPRAVCIVNKGTLTGRGRGIAFAASRVFKTQYASAREKDYDTLPRYIDTFGGYTKLCPNISDDPVKNVARVEWFISTIAHELHHILEDQENCESVQRTGVRVHTISQTINQRRTKWKNRPEEIRALAAEKRVVAQLIEDGIYTTIREKLAAEFNRVAKLKKDSISVRQHHRRIHNCKYVLSDMTKWNRTVEYWMLRGYSYCITGWCCRLADRNKRGRKSYYFKPADGETVI